MLLLFKYSPWLKDAGLLLIYGYDPTVGMYTLFKQSATYQFGFTQGYISKPGNLFDKKIIIG